MNLNYLPSKEPTIKVGIILPVDKMSKVDIVLSDNDNFEIETAEKLYPSCKNFKKLSIMITESGLRLDELSCISTKISIKPITASENTFITLKNVIAGRGFHWQKKIDVKYWGKIDFIVKEKNLLAINEVKLEDYLKCVATSEMSQNCPSEFLISQTIVARSWILANIEQKHKDLNFDVCNDDCCQRYQGLNNCSAESIEAANNSYGKVLIYGNQICDTRYSKSCGGITENFENVWENKRVPYLRSVKDCNHLNKDYCNPDLYPDSSISDYIGSVDEDHEYYRWKFEVDNAFIITSLNEKYKIDATQLIDIKPINKGPSGRIYQLDVIFLDKHGIEKSIVINSEYKIRDLMSKSFLFSSSFSVKKDGEKFILHGKGWGHGVGLCQIGALGMSLSNKKSIQILSHYFPKTEVRKIYNS